MVSGGTFWQETEVLSTYNKNQINPYKTALNLK